MSVSYCLSSFPFFLSKMHTSQLSTQEYSLRLSEISSHFILQLINKLCVRCREKSIGIVEYIKWNCFVKKQRCMDEGGMDSTVTWNGAILARVTSFILNTPPKINKVAFTIKTVAPVSLQDRAASYFKSGYYSCIKCLSN